MKTIDCRHSRIARPRCLRRHGWRRVLVLAASAWGLLACSTTSPVAARVPLDSRITLAPGAQAPVEGTTLRVRFDRVIEDSRCPIDVQCVWAGQARVGITIQDEGGDQQAYVLNTADGRSIVHGAVTIRLEELTPQPVSTRSIPPEDYRATLRTTP